MSKRVRDSPITERTINEPYPDTGETGEAYDQELANILAAIKNRMPPIAIVRTILLTSQESQNKKWNP